MDDAQQLTKVLPRRSVATHLRDVWRYRELLVGMVRKELKVKYKNSSLGFLWSMLNPMLYLAVFYLVFSVFLKSGIPTFPVFLLSGLLVWNLFAGSVSGATAAITGNASLVQKVWFPREVLPFATIGAAFVHYLLQSGVLLGAVLVFRYDIAWSWLWMVIPALVVLLVFTAGVSLLLSSLNVYARDTQHLLELVMLAWFWMTPIVYQYRLVSDRLKGRYWLMLLNPMTSIVVAFQRAIYGKVEPVSKGVRQAILPRAGEWWYLRNLAIVFVGAVLVFIAGIKVYDRTEGNFAEEL